MKNQSFKSFYLKENVNEQGRLVYRQLKQLHSGIADEVKFGNFKEAAEHMDTLHPKEQNKIIRVLKSYPNLHKAVMQNKQDFEFTNGHEYGSFEHYQQAAGEIKKRGDELSIADERSIKTGNKTFFQDAEKRHSKAIEHVNQHFDLNPQFHKYYGGNNSGHATIEAVYDEPPLRKHFDELISSKY